MHALSWSMVNVKATGIFIVGKFLLIAMYSTTYGTNERHSIAERRAHPAQPKHTVQSYIVVLAILRYKELTIFGDHDIFE